MRVDLTNVEEKSFLKAGRHLVKVIKEEQTFSSKGTPVIRVTFADKNKAQITNDFFMTDDAMFRLKLFTKALKMPNIIDTELMVGRYVNINVVDEPYVDKMGAHKITQKIESFEEAGQTNTLEQKDALIQAPVKVIRPTVEKDEPYEIDEDCIPF